jgi:hypothetical protein
MQDLAACEAREKQQRRQAQHEQRQQETRSQLLDDDEDGLVGRYTVTLRGCDTPRLAYGVRGGLIAVVAAPLNQSVDAAGVRSGDEVLAVDGVPLSSSKGVATSAAGVKRLEAAAIQRMQGLRGRRAVDWVLRRPRRARLGRRHCVPPSPASTASSSSSMSDADMDSGMLEISERERRLMGALASTSKT